MSEDRRDSERLEVLGELRGAATVVQPVAIRELSRGGAQVETTFPLQLDSLHEFQLQLGDRSVVVKARIVHCRIADLAEEHVLYRAGIEFVEPPAWATDVIARFIEDVRSGRRG